MVRVVGSQEGVLGCTQRLPPLRYSSQMIDLEHKLKPFIPDFIPAVGDIDAFLKVPRSLGPAHPMPCGGGGAFVPWNPCLAAEPPVGNAWEGGRG